MTDPQLTQKIAELRLQLEKRRGYFLNPDRSMTDDLLHSLIINEERYGYPFCPCRLSSENYASDQDLICPCDYRDPDINEFGACYCGLYVSQAVVKGQKKVESIPERRGQKPLANQLWRCTVCGYLCARSTPPDVCPICGVTHDRFEAYAI